MFIWFSESERWSVKTFAARSVDADARPRGRTRRRRGIITAARRPSAGGDGGLGSGVETHIIRRRERASGAAMLIRINGKEEVIPPGLTVADLLAARGLAPVRVAVEINENLVPRRDYGAVRLAEGDAVEIVTFVGGG